MGSKQTLSLTLWNIGIQSSCSPSLPPTCRRMALRSVTAIGFTAVCTKCASGFVLKVRITELSNNGTISGWYNNTATWRNITVPANGVTLTGTYEPETWYGRERTPREGTITTNPNTTRVCIDEDHKEQFNGSDLYSELKTTNSGDLYHCITVQDYAEYVLSQIASDGTPMDVDQVSTAFDKIIEDLETTTETYKVENGNVLEIPETREITSKVTVTVGSNSTDYTVAQLTTGMNGLKYTEGEGFKWTLTGNLLTEELKLEYHVRE